MYRIKISLKQTVLIVILALSSSGQVQAQTVQWQNALGGTGDDEASSIQQTIDGGYIVAGWAISKDGDLNGGGSGSNYNYDYWVLKLDNTGDTLWQKTYGGTQDEQASSIQQTSDGGYIIAGSSNSISINVSGNDWDYDSWIIHIDSIGNVLWTKAIGGTDYDIPYSIQQTADGGYIIAGYSNSSDGNVPGNHGSRDYWIVKLNNAGSIIWSKVYGGLDYDEATSIDQTTDGGYIVAGYSKSTDGDVNGNHGSADYWILKLDSSGDTLWTKSMGGSTADKPYSIQQTTDGGYIIAGYTFSTDGDILGLGNHGNEDYWIVKLDSTGTLSWSKVYGGTGADVATSIEQTTDGGYIVAGSSGSNNGDIHDNHHIMNVETVPSFDYWLVKLNNIGDTLWTKSLGGSAVDHGNCIDRTTDGGYVVAGHSSSMDGDVVGGVHGGVYPDFWIVKLSANNNTKIENNAFQNSVSLYPNPNNGIFSINMGQLYKNVTVTISDIFGREILKSDFKNEQKINLQITNASGIYFVKIKAANQQKVIKMLRM